MVGNDSTIAAPISTRTGILPFYLHYATILYNEVNQIMATIKDIAKLASVSIATVSIVLNGKSQERKISTKTQDKIYAAVKELNYIPNMSARKLRTVQHESYSVAFYWATDFRINFLARFMLGIQQELAKYDIPIHVTIVPYRVDQLNRQMTLTQNVSFNGVIIANMSDRDLAFLATQTPSFPVVLFNRELPNYSSVTMDNYAVGHEVADHFLKKQQYNTGLFIHDQAFPLMGQWIDSFLAAYREAGHPIQKENITLCGTSEKSSAQALQLLHRRKALPKALFCASDVLARGTIFACSQEHIRVPEDMEIFTVGMCMPEINEYTVPSLSLIDIPLDTVGAQCLRLLVNLIENKIANPTVLWAKGTKIVRESSL